MRQGTRATHCGGSLGFVPSGVLIDGRAAARPETGGVERWARELCARLPIISAERYAVADPGEFLSHRLGQLWEQTVLPFRASRSNSALLCPANLAPLAGANNIVVIHDAAPLRFPDDFSGAYSRWQSFLLPRIASRALHVIVPSEFSRGEVIELCGADPDRVTVVLGGVPDDYRQAVDPVAVLEDLGISGPYVLTVASKVRRKNLSALEPVAQALAAEGVSLIAVGGGRPQFGVSGSERGGGVVELGPLSDSLLPSLYSGALAFVLPSIYEGFGLPVCEAMACGTPVVCSNLASLPEAAGGAALLTDPSDPEELVSKVFEACFDSESRQRLIGAGRDRVAGLTWQATADGVDRVCSAFFD